MVPGDNMAAQCPEQQLLVAARDGDGQAVRRLLEGSRDIAVYQEEEEGTSALILAAKKVSMTPADCVGNQMQTLG